jgi:hypothetical protein
MDTKTQKLALSNLPDTPEGLDPTNRVFVPIEHPTSDGRTMFRTLDTNVYERFPNGQIINRSRLRGSGKASRKARRQARQHARD